ncbi:MAG: hypothetical protein ACPGUD_00605 [Parashewanella sp.]
MAIAITSQPSLLQNVTDEDIKRFNRHGEVQVTCRAYNKKLRTYKVRFTQNEFQISLTSNWFRTPYCTTFRIQDPKDPIAKELLKQFVALPEVSVSAIFSTLTNTEITEDERANIYLSLSAQTQELLIALCLGSKPLKNIFLFVIAIRSLPPIMASACINALINQSMTNSSNSAIELTQLFDNDHWDEQHRLLVITHLPEQLLDQIKHELPVECLARLLNPTHLPSQPLSLSDYQLNNYLSLLTSLAQHLITVVSTLPSTLFVLLILYIAPETSATLLCSLEPLQAKLVLNLLIRYQSASNCNRQDNSWDLTFIVPSLYSRLAAEKQLADVLTPILSNAPSERLIQIFNQMNNVDKQVFFNLINIPNSTWLEHFFSEIELSDFDSLLSGLAFDLRQPLLLLMLNTPNKAITTEELINVCLKLNEREQLSLLLNSTRSGSILLFCHADKEMQKKCIVHPDFIRQSTLIKNSVAQIALSQEVDCELKASLQTWLKDLNLELLMLLLKNANYLYLLSFSMFIPNKLVGHFLRASRIRIIKSDLTHLTTRFSFFPYSKVMFILAQQSNYHERLNDYIAVSDEENKHNIISYLINHHSMVTPAVITTLINNHRALLLEVASLHTYSTRQYFISLFSHEQWRQLVISTPKHQRHQLINFYDQRQVTLWLAQKDSDQSVVLLLKEADVAQMHQLLVQLPLNTLATGLLMLDEDMAYTHIQNACFAPNIAEVLHLMYQQNASKTLAILHHHQHVSDREKVIASLDNRANKQDKESKKELQQHLFLLCPETSDKLLKIKKAYMNHKRLLARRFARLADPSQTFLPLEYRAKNQGPVTRYYFTKKHKISPLRSPKKVVPPEAIIGGFKTLTRIDNEYVEFSLTSDDPITYSQYRDDEDSIELSRDQFLHELFKQIDLALRKHPKARATIQMASQGFNVKDDSFIAVNGGDNLSSFVNKHPVSIGIFESACRCLDLLHERHIYLRDIKPDNLLIKTTLTTREGKTIPILPQLQYIDLDSCFTYNLGETNDDCRTEDYCTQELYDSKEKSLANRDQYAFILTVLYCISPNSRTFQWVKVDKTEIDSVESCTTTAMFKKGVLHASSASEAERAIIDRFIEKYIKQQHKNKVKRLLKDPVNHPLTVPLSEVFDWSADNESVTLHSINPFEHD